MKKRISVFFIIFAFLLTLNSIMLYSKKNALAVDTKQNSGLETISKSAYLIDEKTNTIIYSKNENEKLPIASMCKIMTLLLTFEEIDKNNLNLEDEIIVSENASKMGGSQVFLLANEKYKVSELIKSIVVASANDSCFALAERIGGTEQGFIDMMNNKCKELKMDNTRFSNCTGLPKEGQYSTAKDVSIMFSELIKHKTYFNYSKIWTEEFKHPSGKTILMTNTNKLIRFYEGCEGGKTGYTSEAGFCLASVAKRNNLSLISVVISAPDTKTRFNDITNMFNYGFNNYENKLILDKDKITELDIELKNSNSDTITVKAEENFYILSKKGQQRAFDIEYKLKDDIKAPIKPNDIIGEINIYENNVCIKTLNLLSDCEIKKANLFDNIKKIIKNITII